MKLQDARKIVPAPGYVAVEFGDNGIEACDVRPGRLSAVSSTYRLPIDVGSTVVIAHTYREGMPSRSLWIDWADGDSKDQPLLLLLVHESYIVGVCK